MQLSQPLDRPCEEPPKAGWGGNSGEKGPSKVASVVAEVKTKQVSQTQQRKGKIRRPLALLPLGGESHLVFMHFTSSSTQNILCTRDTVKSSIYHFSVNQFVTEA